MKIWLKVTEKLRKASLFQKERSNMEVQVASKHESMLSRAEQFVSMLKRSEQQSKERIQDLIRCDNVMDGLIRDKEQKLEQIDQLSNHLQQLKQKLLSTNRTVLPDDYVTSKSFLDLRVFMSYFTMLHSTIQPLPILDFVFQGDPAPQNIHVLVSIQGLGLFETVLKPLFRNPELITKTLIRKLINRLKHSDVAVDVSDTYSHLFGRIKRMLDKRWLSKCKNDVIRIPLSYFLPFVGKEGDLYTKRSDALLWSQETLAKIRDDTLEIPHLAFSSGDMRDQTSYMAFLFQFVKNKNPTMEALNALKKDQFKKVRASILRCNWWSTPAYLEKLSDPAFQMAARCISDAWAPESALHARIQEIYQGHWGFCWTQKPNQPILKCNLSIASPKTRSEKRKKQEQQEDAQEEEVLEPPVSKVSRVAEVNEPSDMDE